MDNHNANHFQINFAKDHCTIPCFTKTCRAVLVPSVGPSQSDVRTDIVLSCVLTQNHTE